MDGHYSPAAVRGFSLIEIAIVLFIIGLVLGGIVSFVNAMVINRQIEATKTKQEAIKTALISFIARNNRMPCPALPNLAEGATNDGVEATPAAGPSCTGLTPSGAGADQVVTGVVPWVSIGLTSENALDAYANRFTYQVVLSATALTAATISGMSGRITIHSAGPGTLGATPAGNQTNFCSGAVNPCAAVAVIVSHGKDGYGAYTRTGLQIRHSPTDIFPPEVIGNDARENANGDSKFVIKDFSDVPTNPFDDMVMALTTNDLLSPLVMAGTLKDYRTTLNNTFQIIQSSIVAYGVNHRSGSAGNWSYLIPDSGTLSGLLSSAQTTDPWGSPIIYAPVISSVASGSTSSAAAATLTSYGPDKASGGGDDIVQTISVADLQNIFQLSGW